MILFERSRQFKRHMKAEALKFAKDAFVEGSGRESIMQSVA